MHINRLNGFFIGGTFLPGGRAMTIDEQNQHANEALDVRFEQLKAAWEEHEKALKAMRPLESVTCCYSSEVDDSGGALCNLYLGYWKDNGQWRIYHGDECEPHDQHIHWTPIHEASARYRIKAASHIDVLREELVKSKNEFIPELDAAITTLARKLEDYKSG